MTTLQERIERGDVIILDGATGTELERRGAPLHKVAWSAAALLTHPDIVREVHEDYVRAGADIITTNTFQSARHILELAGLGEKTWEMNTAAVRLAREAIDNTSVGWSVDIAGSICSRRPLDRRQSVPPDDQFEAGYREQAELLAEAGADLLVLEMMDDIKYTSIALKAALATGLPTWVGFSCELPGDRSTVMLLKGAETLGRGIEAVMPLGGSLVAVMHSTTEDIEPALRVVKESWEGPVGAYAHSKVGVPPDQPSGLPGPGAEVGQDGHSGRGYLLPNGPGVYPATTRRAAEENLLDGLRSMIVEKAATQSSETVSEKIAGVLERWSGWLLLCVVILTVLFAIPIFTMAPEDTASDSPGGAVYDLQNLIDHTLPPRVHSPAFLVEAGNGDILTQEPLWELFQNTEKLREADAQGELNPPDLPKQPYLYNGFDADRQAPVVGVFTLADAVQEALKRDPRLATDLEQASDEQVKLALHLVFSDPRTDALKDTLSEKKKVERQSVLDQEIDYWTSPAFFLNVFADNNKLGGSSLRIGSIDPVTEGKEHFNRKVQELLRGEQESYQLWGVAIDAGLEIADEVSTAVPFIGATFLMVLVVVGISLRSGRVVFLTALGLISMIIWLKGLSNLVGLNSSTTLDFIMPIAMISLGADFAIHAVHRYREERKIGLGPRSAFRAGIGAVLVALVLATLTDSIAFLSNTSADIETVVGFGIGAALAVLATFVILGIAVPLALMRLDVRRGNPKARGGRRGRHSHSELQSAR